MRTLCIRHLQYLQSFRNCCLFCTYWLIENLNCTDSHHASYGERCSNHHSRHCAQCVSETYSVLKLFVIAVCFAHIGLFEIWTALTLTILAMVNVVQIIMSDFAYSVYLRLTVFWNFSKLQLVLHILAYSKFLLRWGASSLTIPNIIFNSKFLLRSLATC